MQSLVKAHKDRLATLSTRHDFSRTFHLLHATRCTDVAARVLPGPFADRDVIARASEMTREYLEEQGEIPFLKDFLEAAREAWTVRDEPLPDPA